MRRKYQLGRIFNAQGMKGVKRYWRVVGRTNGVGRRIVDWVEARCRMEERDRQV